MRSRLWQVMLLAACWAASTAWGQAGPLGPRDVAVLVNSDVPDSLALGRYYCANRGVSEGNLIALKLPTGDNISAEDYNTLVVAPLRKALTDRKLDKQIRCILTVSGVPFRVQAALKMAPANQIFKEWCTKARAEAHRNLALDVERLKLVGTHFPPKASSATSVDHLEDHFDSTPVLPDPLPKIEGLGQSFPILARERDAVVEGIADADRKAVARRQLLALYLDALGYNGLIPVLSGSLPPGAPTAPEARRKLSQIQASQAELQAIETKEGLTPELLDRLGAFVAGSSGAKGLYDFTQGQLERLDRFTSQAAFDNELALLWAEDYPRDGFLPNPLRWDYSPEKEGAFVFAGPGVLMVSRIDGPGLAVPLRMIKDALAAEAEGLKGKFYIDGGVQKPEYKMYDTHLLRLSGMVKAQTDFPVVMDQGDAVFQPGKCPDAALYVGWYSLSKYVPAFTWNRGAVGYHIASFEAMHIRDPKSTEWVPQMLQAGVAATLGSSDEPFLQAFPLPEEFFPLLLSGKVTLAEAYWRTTPKVSWRMMLFGDPLYNPFKANPHAMKLPLGMLPLAGAAPATSTAPAGRPRETASAPATAATRP